MKLRVGSKLHILKKNRDQNYELNKTEKKIKLIFKPLKHKNKLSQT